MLVIRAVVHKMLVRITNREDPDQTASSEQSDLGLHCVSRLFFHAHLYIFLRTYEEALSSNLKLIYISVLSSFKHVLWCLGPPRLRNLVKVYTSSSNRNDSFYT